MPTDQVVWLTIPETAEVLKLSERTVRRMISSGEIDARRLGSRSVRVNAASLLPANVGKPLAFQVGDAQ